MAESNYTNMSTATDLFGQATEQISIMQPVPYQGSKRRIAQDIASWFPDKIRRFLEPFAGSAAMSLAMALRNSDIDIWINDINAPLIGIWHYILKDPKKISDQYEHLWTNQVGRERQFYNEIRNRFNKHHEPSDLLYLLARCVKASVRYNSKGEFNNSPDNRRRGARPEEMRRRIMLAHRILAERTIVTSLDYENVVEQYRAGDLLYMDPPYQGVSNGRDTRYYTSFSHKHFCTILDRLNSLDAMYAVSYDGRTGAKMYGEPMPADLKLFKVEICAGRSTQATLLGRNSLTYESLYLSPALAGITNSIPWAV